jgi:hypothetical protein
MHGREVHDETRMLGELFSDFFAIVHTDVVTHEMNRADLLVNLPVQCFEKVDELSLALPVIPVPVDLARTGVKGCQEIEGPCTLVLVLVPVRKVLRLDWLGRSVPRSQLEGGLLVHGQDQFIEMQRPRAIAISSQSCRERQGRDTGTRPSSQPHLNRFSWCVVRTLKVLR